MKLAVLFLVLVLLPGVAANSSFETASLAEMTATFEEHFPRGEAVGVWYGVGRFMEEVQMMFTFDRAAKARLSDLFARRRFGEALAFLDAENPAEARGRMADFRQEVARLQEQVTIAENSGQGSAEITEAGRKTLLGAVLQLELLPLSQGNFSSDILLDTLAEIDAARNRSPVADQRAVLASLIPRMLEQGKLRQIAVVEGELESSLTDVESALNETDPALFQQKAAATQRRLDGLKQAVKAVGRHIQEQDNESVRNGYRALTLLLQKIEAFQPAVGRKEQRLAGTTCAQIVTRALEPNTGLCRAFSTPCDVPDGWVTVDQCPDRQWCAQVATPALNPRNGQCITFPSPCQLPSGWLTVDTCEAPA